MGQGPAVEGAEVGASIILYSPCLGLFIANIRDIRVQFDRPSSVDASHRVCAGIAPALGYRDTAGLAGQELNRENNIF